MALPVLHLDRKEKQSCKNGIQEDQHRTILFLHKCLLRTVRLLVIASIPLHLLFKESSGLNDTSGEAESKCTEYRNIPPNHLIVSVSSQMVSGKAIIEKNAASVFQAVQQEDSCLCMALTDCRITTVTAIQSFMQTLTSQNFDICQNTFDSIAFQLQFKVSIA